MKKQKQTIQFKLEDVQFVKNNKAGTLVCLPRTAPAVLLMTADSATLKVDNQKNGWKGICVHQEANGELLNCPVRALARRVLHLREHNAVGKTLLSAFFHLGVWYDVSNDDISKGLKLAAQILQYPTTRGIPIERIDTHSFRRVQMHWLYQATPMYKYKKWEDGKGRLSNNIFVRS